jgi:hypothetical protein
MQPVMSELLMSAKVNTTPGLDLVLAAAVYLLCVPTIY